MANKITKAVSTPEEEDAVMMNEEVATAKKVQPLKEALPLQKATPYPRVAQNPIQPLVEPEVQMVSETPAAVPGKMVKIRLRVNHSCHIGTTSYDFEKGKTYNVPENVRDILIRSDLLAPL